jgi:protein phosphatase PTC6
MFSQPNFLVPIDRIRKMAAYVTADSFGENMFLGQLANTRALGDVAMKPFGVSAEPELIRRTIKASEAAFLVLVSDGISSVMSNQEVVDCIKLEENPTQAAANVLNLAEQLGAEDNCTIMV